MGQAGLCTTIVRKQTRYQRQRVVGNTVNTDDVFCVPLAQRQYNVYHTTICGEDLDVYCPFYFGTNHGVIVYGRHIFGRNVDAYVCASQALYLVMNCGVASGYTILNHDTKCVGAQYRSTADVDGVSVIVYGWYVAGRTAYGMCAKVYWVASYFADFGKSVVYGGTSVDG